MESDVAEARARRTCPRCATSQALQRSTGVGGELDLVVSGRRVTDPEVVRWMTGYQREVLKRFGYSERRGCGEADLCPAFSLPDLFAGGVPRSQRAGRHAARLRPAVLLARRHHPRPADRDAGVRHPAHAARAPAASSSRRMRRRLDPPAGVRAELAGLPVLAAEANDRVSSPLAALRCALAGLARRGARPAVAPSAAGERALVPLVPIALATGWSALVLFALRIPLNPMSVTLGALVIAISTEFSVLLSERYRAERARRARAARRRSSAPTARPARAVLASGVTAIAGFAVLVVSDIRMLRDFGFVTVVDLDRLAARRAARPARGAPARRGGRLRVPRGARRRAGAASRAPRSPPVAG